MSLAENEAFCIKCGKGKAMKEKYFTRYKNNMPVMRGKCIDCGTGVTKLLTRELALKEELKQLEQKGSEEGEAD